MSLMLLAPIQPGRMCSSRWCPKMLADDGRAPMPLAMGLVASPTLPSGLPIGLSAARLHLTISNHCFPNKIIIVLSSAGNQACLPNKCKQSNNLCLNDLGECSQDFGLVLSHPKPTLSENSWHTMSISSTVSPGRSSMLACARHSAKLNVLRFSLSHIRPNWRKTSCIAGSPASGTPSC